MNQSIYSFTDYKAFVLETIESMENQGRGVRRRIAEFIGCQVAYVSQVLAADRHFSLEQGEALARFLGLLEDETEFLFLLIEHARAGTVELKRVLQKRIDEKTKEYRDIKKRIRITDEISAADQAQYYSTWHYQAVRTSLTIPELRTPQALAQKLQLPRNRINEILNFLSDKGLVRETESGFETTSKQIHLARTSPLISKLHTNWRVKTLSALEQATDEDYHYSGLMTMSVEDMKRVREVMMKALTETVAIVQPSKEERLCVLAMDFFEL